MAQLIVPSPERRGSKNSWAQAQDNIGGHIGFVLPLVTHAGGQTTSLADSFSIGFPLGVTFKGKGRMAYARTRSRNTKLPPQSQSHSPSRAGMETGTRLGGGNTDVNSSQFGFTPLVNKSWPIKSKSNFFKAYFVEAVLPVRFNRPTSGPSTNPVPFGLHFGLGF